MKILTTIFDANNIKTLSAYADGFLIGNHQFGTRLTRSFEIHEIISIVSLIKSLNKEVFLVINQLFTDEKLDALKIFLNALPLKSFSGIIISDIGVIPILNQYEVTHLIIYHPETLLTNTYDFNFLSEYQIQGAFVAKEITLNDVLEIAKEKKYKLFMIGHGHLSMFYSKRRLIENFLEFSELDLHLSNDQDLRLIEEHRKDESFPILEDDAGTHVFSSKVFSSILHLNDLLESVDYLLIDSIFKDDLYALSVLKMYHSNEVNHDVKAELEKNYHETWDQGFFYKKTIYKQTKENES